MILLRIGTYDVPTDLITKYDVKYSKIYGANEQLEDGTTYTEQVRSRIPLISVEFKNLLQHQVDRIMETLEEGQFDVEYYFGGTQHARMRVSGDITLALKTLPDDAAYFDMALELEG